MSVISWNCRGLGNPRTVREVLDLVSKKLPAFVFLMETKTNRNQVETLRSKLGYGGVFCVDSVGRSGGLALFWKDRNTARLISYSRNHIDIEVTLQGMSIWRLTGFYGHPERIRRNDSWTLLRELHSRSDLPWLIIGDFNELLSQSEKHGSHPHPVQLINNFQEALLDCGLSELKLLGHPFTWEKGRGSETFVEEKLDRAVATDSWRMLNREATVENLETFHSDHTSLFMNIKGNIQSKPPRRFRFENSWLKERECSEVIARAWLEVGNENLQHKLDNCGKRLLAWGGEKNSKFGKRIKELRRCLSQLKQKYDADSIHQYKEAYEQLQTLQEQEEVYWKQRSKRHWLAEGDANTKGLFTSFICFSIFISQFFHFSSFPSPFLQFSISPFLKFFNSVIL